MTGTVREENRTRPLVSAVLAALLLAYLSAHAGVRLTRAVRAPAPVRPPPTLPADIPPEAPGFARFASGIIPPSAAMRFVGTGSCVELGPVDYYIAYALVPRFLTCDADVRYVVYVRSRARIAAPRSARLYSFAPGWAVVDTRPARSPG